jgi:hypothetical protein
MRQKHRSGLGDISDPQKAETPSVADLARRMSELKQLRDLVRQVEEASTYDRRDSVKPRARNSRPSIT